MLQLNREVSDPLAGLWDHQHEEVAHHALDRERVLLWEPRVGKTRATLRSFLRMHRETGVSRFLVSAPKTVCQIVWGPEIAAMGAELASEGWQLLDLYSGALPTRRALLGESKARRKRLAGEQSSESPTVAVVNRDVLSDLADAILSWGPQVFVLDELHDYKSPGAQRSRAAFRIGRAATFRRGLTGTPTPRSYADIYGQWKIISPATFGTNYGAFAQKYLTRHPIYQNKIIGYQNLDELQERAFSIASIKRREECFDIPAVQEVERYLTLPDSVQALYDKIVREHILEIETARTARQEIPITHTLARMTQLRQIATGYARFDEHGLRVTDWLHTETVEAVVDEAEDIVENNKKVVIFHHFRPEGEKIEEKLAHLRPLVLNGDTPNHEREKIVRQFNTSEHFPVIIVQEKVGSLGISLKAADFALFASTGFNHDDHKQARDRIFDEAKNKPGGLTYIYFWTQGTAHSFVRQTLRRKAKAEEHFMRGDLATQFRNAAYGMVS